MHIKKKYKNAGRAAFKYAMEVANKLSVIINAHTGTTPDIVMAGSRTQDQGGFATSTVRLLFKNVGNFDPLSLDPDTLPEDIVDIGKNTNGEFPVTIDVAAVSGTKKEGAGRKKESTDIVNARKIQAGLTEMEEMLAAVGKNVSFEYIPDDDIVKISVDNQVVKIASVGGDSAITAMNDVWSAVYRYLT